LPVYFFHLIEGDQVTPDSDGVEKSDLAAVQKEAIDAASELIAEAVRKGERDFHGRFEVEDERGARVLTLTFACPIGLELTSH
jgi:hypothetical protein